MEDNNEEAELPAAPRRSRRLALSELNESVESIETPNKISSPDEMIIIQRGPRRKPVTWSPVDYQNYIRNNGLGAEKDKTPEKKATRSQVNPKLRRRLVMSPNKTTSRELGEFISKRLCALHEREKNGL